MQRRTPQQSSIETIFALINFAKIQLTIRGLRISIPGVFSLGKLSKKMMLKRKYVPTNVMMADMLKKSLSKLKHEKLIKLMKLYKYWY